MAKHYKELANCRMCKKRFVVNKDPELHYSAKLYCKPCCLKYFKEEWKDSKKK